ncbi:unnamed protein product [Rotaria sp. Silwood2]|nr:unnamed protein product [Rotaria sp. Silwood2]
MDNQRLLVTSEYIPPKNDQQGLCIALTIFILFVIFWYHALFQINLMDIEHRSPWWDIIGTFLILEFLYTGLFITCHDAMHGAIIYQHRKLNNAIGKLCITAYAWFDYQRLYEKHWRHHNHTGIVDHDPDYHDGQRISLFFWYFKFMWGYSSLLQLTKVGLWGNFLMYICSVQFINIIIYMLICPICSSFRLFYFGTYLPHRPEVINSRMVEKMPWEKSRSSNVNRLVSFLCCYHFDYHWEHHRWPYAPWWNLWKCKEIQQRMKKSS